MRFYDFMTMFWGVMWGAAAGVFTYSLASSQRGPAWVLGGIAAVGMAVTVYFWRMFKDPG